MAKTTKSKSSKSGKLYQRLQDWSTTKTSLFLAMIAVTSYLLISLIISAISMVMSAGTVSYLDPTLTSEWFEFWKWVVAGGGTVSIFNILNSKKSKTPTKVKFSINEEEE